MTGRAAARVEKSFNDKRDYKSKPAWSQKTVQNANALDSDLQTDLETSKTGARLTSHSKEGNSTTVHDELQPADAEFEPLWPAATEDDAAATARRSRVDHWSRPYVNQERLDAALAMPEPDPVGAAPVEDDALDKHQPSLERATSHERAFSPSDEAIRSCEYLGSLSYSNC